MTTSLEGKVALVTGSSSGIGEATARMLSELGAIVAVNSSRSVEKGLKVAGGLRGAIYVQADISDAEQSQQMIDEVVKRLGGLDILVNNAGTTVVIPHSNLEAATPEVWRRIFDTNVIGTWQTTVAAVPHLRASGAGCVVNVSSLAGERPTGSSIPYASSKAALAHMTRLLANTLAPEIRVNAVAPGLVDTPWTEDWHDIRKFVEAAAPMHRPALPADVAEAILSFVTSTFITGQVLVVDGGLSLR